jgi:hypothetical protein
LPLFPFRLFLSFIAESGTDRYWCTVPGGENALMFVVPLARSAANSCCNNSSHTLTFRSVSSAP